MSQAVVDNVQDPAENVPQLSAAERSLIDASARSVVLSFLLTAFLWLVLASLFGAILALQLIFPGFLDFSFSNFGKLEPVARVAFTYGWCGAAGMGVSAWLVSRLSARRLVGGSFAVFGAALWNLGLLLGILSIAFGKMRPLSGLEIPHSAAVIMFSGFVMYLIPVLCTFRVVSGKVPLSLMFVLGGNCWMAWSFLVGNLLASSGNLVGVMSQVSADWTVSSVRWLWLVSLGLGSAYYIIPKVSGNSIYSGMLGRGCFWLYILVAGLGASARLSGGPIPLWLSSVGASASILLLVPVLGSVYNLLSSAGSASKVMNSPAGRFSCFGLLLLGVGTFLNALSALRSIHFAVQFTLFDAGVSNFILNGFVTMSLFGAIYYIMPRLSACEWLSSTLVSGHFLGSAYGTAMGSLSLVLSGIASGAGLDSPDSTFRQILDLGASYYWARVISYLLLAFGLLAFGLNFLLIALRVGQPAGEPTLFRNAEDH